MNEAEMLMIIGMGRAMQVAVDVPIGDNEHDGEGMRQAIISAIEKRTEKPMWPPAVVGGGPAP